MSKARAKCSIYTLSLLILSVTICVLSLSILQMRKNLGLGHTTSKWYKAGVKS